jgi:hypothetical protein
VRREERLLLLLARGSFGRAIADRARDLITPGLDWPSLLRLSDAHGVVPLVARNLGALPDAAIPESVRRAADRARQVNAARNLLGSRVLEQALGSLGKVGIRVMPLKGVALGQWLYGDASLRVSGDVDILVPRQDAARALRLLSEHGYATAPGEPRVAAQDVDLLLESNIEYGLLPPECPDVPLELHWGIAWRWVPDAAIEDLWATSAPAWFAGVETRRPSPEWELLYLAVHAARHRWQALKWLVDLHEAFGRGQAQWRLARKTAVRFGLESVLDLAAALCRTLFDSPVADGAAPAPLPSWVRVFPSGPAAAGQWRDAAFPTRLLARPSDKLRYLARVLFLPTLAERRLVRLPAALAPLYYPLRPLRLAGRLGRDAVRAGRARAQEADRLDRFPASGRSSGLEARPDGTLRAPRSNQETA